MINNFITTKRRVICQKEYIFPQPIAKEGEEYLLSQEYENFRGGQSSEKHILKKDIAYCDAMLLRTHKVDKEILEAGKNLKVIARHGAGYDNLDYLACKELGIEATFSPNSTGLSVAEFAITSMLMLAKRIDIFEKEMRNDNFNFKFTRKGADVYGKTLGILGLGKIGLNVYGPIHSSSKIYIWY